METVSVNGLTLCHQNSRGYTRSTLPDMCRSPKAPLPYTNIAFARDLAGGTLTVRSHGGAMNGVKGSRFRVSQGDDPGIGLGVKSGTVKAEATWLSWSPNVFMEGRPATRLTDKMLMNRGNTISAAGYKTDDVKGVKKEYLDELCEIACQCRDAKRRQDCVAEKIREKYFDKMYPRDWANGACPEVSMARDGDAFKVIMNRAGTGPTSNPYTPLGGIRPDVLCRQGGKNSLMVEMKFKGDTLSRNQTENYPKAAEDLGADYKALNVEEECDCPDGGGTAPAPVTVPGKEQDPSKFTTPLEQVAPPKTLPWTSPPPPGLMCDPEPFLDLGPLGKFYHCVER